MSLVLINRRELPLKSGRSNIQANMYYMVLITIVCCLFSSNNNQFKALAEPPMTASELIVSRGFNVEEFDVISDHTYNLKIYHIINPLADPKTLNPIPVVCHHGVIDDMTHMMENSINARPRKPNPSERVTLYAMENGADDRNLYFYLSNNNYDVWLLEARGSSNRVLKKMKDKRSKNRSFWDWSIDDLVLIDLPTQIDFVLMKTKQEKVSYIAFSESTLFMFALLSMKPEFSQKLTTFIAQAPIVYGNNLRGALWPLLLLRTYIFSSSSSNSITPKIMNAIGRRLIRYICSIDFIRVDFCSKLWTAVSGKKTTDEIEGAYVDKVAQQISIKAFEQFVHNTMIKDFRMYDYKDELKNYQEYGQVIAPQYNISNINLRTIVLFRGVNDYLSDPFDQIIMSNRLKVPIYEDHILESYSHLDFQLSPTVVRDINEPVLRVLDKLTNRNVTRVLHTLGRPNELVVGTPLVIDLLKEGNGSIYGKDSRYEETGTHKITEFSSTPEAEKSDRGTLAIDSDSVRKQLFGTDDTEKIVKKGTKV